MQVLPLIGLFLFFTTANRAQTSFIQLLHKTHAQRFSAIQLEVMEPCTHRELDSTRALLNIRAVEKLAIENNDEDLLLETKVCKLQYINSLSIWGRYPASLAIEQITALRDWARQKKILWAEARLESLLAQQYYSVKQYEKAFERLYAFYNLIKNVPPEEYPDKKNAFCIFANNFYSFKDYRSAIFFMHEALRDSIRRPWDVYYFQSFNTMGLCYRDLNKLDSSNYFFELTRQKALAENNGAWVAIAAGNLGENWFIHKVYAKAEPLLKLDADRALRDKDWGLAANALGILAEINLLNNALKSAEDLLTQARDAAYKSGEYKRKTKLYRALSKYYIANGDKRLANQYLDSAYIVRDSLDREFNALVATRATQRIELENYNLAMQEIKAQKEMKTFQRNALMLIVLMALLVAYIIIDNQRKKVKRKHIELERAKEELKKAGLELEGFTKSIAEKNQLIDDLKQQITDPDSEALRELQQSTILTDEQWLDFRNLFGKVHLGYLQRLSEKIPGLTPAETRFVLLNKLKLSSREMASMLGVGADAVRQIRSRLRKKINHSEDDNLDELIQKI